MVLVALGAGVFALKGDSAPPPPALNLSGFGQAPAAGGGALSSSGGGWDFEEVHGLFLRGRLSEVRERFDSLSAEKEPRLASLREHLNAALEAKRLLDARDFHAAERALDRIDGEFRDANFVAELRDNIAWEQGVAARGLWDKASNAYEAGRFSEASRLYAEAHERKPEEFPQAKDLAESAQLAELASPALTRALPALESRDYAEVVRLVRVALDKIEIASENARAEPKVADFSQKLNDLYHHASLESGYQEGRGSDALASAAQISEGYRGVNDLDRRISHINKVVELFERAEAENSLEVAREVYATEGSPANAYHRRARALEQEIARQGRDKAQALLDQAKALERERRLDQALELTFQARQADPAWDEAVRRHNDVGLKILDFAKRIYPYEEGARDRKAKLYELIKRHSLRTDAIYQQAVNQSNDLATFKPGQN